MDRALVADFAERTVDEDPEIALGGFLTRLYLRKWTLAVCIVVPTLLGLLMTAFTPVTWTGSTKILIRYGSSESAFLQGLIPDNRAAISGAVSGEIMRSLPTLEATIRRYHVEAGDIYSDPTSVAISRMMAYLPQLLSRPGAGTSDDDNVQALARVFQQSLLESSKVSAALGSKTRPLEVLSKESTIPQSMIGDELITLTVRSFNRTKVAEMTNGLAATFIDQYYTLSEQDAHRSVQFLTLLADQSEREVRQLEAAPNPAADERAPVDGGSLARGGAAATAMTARLADLETQLARAQQIYTDDSPKVQRAQAEIADIKRLLGGQERLEVAKDVLQQVRTRRFQAINTESLYRSHLVPISIVEPAVTPEASGASIIRRLVVSGVSGGLIGFVLGMAVVTILGLLEERLFTTADVERALRLPIFGSLPHMKSLGKRRNGKNRLNIGDAGSGVMRILAHLDPAGPRSIGQVVAIASGSDGDGKSLIAMLLAQAVARAGRAKVLLIDADPLQASVTRTFNPDVRMTDSESLSLTAPGARLAGEVAVSSGVANLDIIPARSIGERNDRGLYLRHLRELLDEARDRYDMIIVDTPSLSEGSEALTYSMAADQVLIVVRFGATRRSDVRGFVRKLREVAVIPQGVIFNFRKNVLPGFMSWSAD